MTWNEADLFALALLAPLSQRYLPWTGWAMRPSALVAILHEVTYHDRKSVLECGQGISTVYLARELAASGGHLYSIEHDPDWSSLVRRLLEREGLDGCVTSIFAPLEPYGDGGATDSWYSRSVVERDLEGVKVDLLVVDGPPAGPSRAEARYPALPVLFPYLGPEAAIMLDDADRPGEQRVIERWQAELPLTFSSHRLMRVARAQRAARSYAASLPFHDASFGARAVAEAAREARAAASRAEKAATKLARRVEKTRERIKAVDRRLESLESTLRRRPLIALTQRGRGRA